MTTRPFNPFDLKPLPFYSDTTGEWTATDVTHTGSGVSVDGGTLNVRTKAKLQAQWVSGATVANDTVYLVYDAPYAGTVNSLTYFTGTGSFSVAIQINGASVTGLSAISVSSATPATANASGANTFAAGNKITAVVTGASGNPTDALLSADVTWTS